jgi:predicted nucleic acid-binding protein
MIVLDTNVLSELLKPARDPNGKAWGKRQPNASLFISTITQAESRYGLALLPDGQRKDGLLAAAHTMFSKGFAGRILPFDNNAAVFYAQVAATRRRTGRPISQFDAQIAAVARSRGGPVATRNVDDFSDCGIEVINPWLTENSSE